jgi:hypothetical protein
MRSCRPAGGAKGPQLQELLHTAIERWCLLPLRGSPECYKPPGKEKSKSTGRKRAGQERHPGANRNVLPAEQCAEVIPHVPITCRSCGEALSGADPEPHRHPVVDIPKIEPFVIEHQLHG